MKSMNISIPENAVTDAVAAAIERNPLVAGIVAGAAVATVAVLAAPGLYRLARSGAAAVADTADHLASRLRGAFRRNPQPDMNKPGPTVAADDFVDAAAA